VHQSILREDHIEAAIRKGQRSRLDQLEANLAGKSLAGYAFSRSLDQLFLNINTDHLASSMLGDEQSIDTSHTGPDIENAPSENVVAPQHLGDFLRTSRRQKAITPHELQRVSECFAVLHLLASAIAPPTLASGLAQIGL
jgi:hypothetical protein